MTAYLDTDTECLHGLDTVTCSICRKAAGYMPGTDRTHNDCTVIAVQHLTGATYAEAELLMAEAGRRGGRGAQVEATHAALAEAGWTVTPSRLSIEQAVASGRSFLVSAARGRKGHAWAIIAGQQLNHWRHDYRYRIYEVS